MKILKIMVASIVSLSLISCSSDNKTENTVETKLPKISVQLWSVKSKLKQTLPGL